MLVMVGIRGYEDYLGFLGIYGVGKSSYFKVIIFGIMGVVFIRGEESL